MTRLWVFCSSPFCVCVRRGSWNTLQCRGEASQLASRPGWVVGGVLHRGGGSVQSAKGHRNVWSAAARPLRAALRWTGPRPAAAAGAARKTPQVRVQIRNAPASCIFRPIFTLGSPASGLGPRGPTRWPLM